MLEVQFAYAWRDSRKGVRTRARLSGRQGDKVLKAPCCSRSPLAGVRAVWSGRPCYRAALHPAAHLLSLKMLLKPRSPADAQDLSVQPKVQLRRQVISSDGPFPSSEK